MKQKRIEKGSSEPENDILQQMKLKRVTPKEMTMQELTAFINQHDGDFIISVEFGEEGEAYAEKESI